MVYLCSKQINMEAGIIMDIITRCCSVAAQHQGAVCLASFQTLSELWVAKKLKFQVYISSKSSCLYKHASSIARLYIMSKIASVPVTLPVIEFMREIFCCQDNKYFLPKY